LKNEKRKTKNEKRKTKYVRDPQNMKLFTLFLLIAPWLVFANIEAPKLTISTLAENVYQFTSYKRIEPWGMVGANGLIVVDGADAHLIDTPWTVADTKQLITWAESKKLTLKSAVITHSHEDASGGISFLNSLQIKTYATPLTNSLLKIKKSEQSNHIITTTTYEVVANNIEVFFPGPGHSQDNVVVWLPKSHILFGGCFVRHIDSHTLGNTADASIKEWPLSLQKVIDKYGSIEVVVPGHGKVGNMNLLTHTAELAMGEKGL
jgi:glyoxylase-like metal-dependent hydrolase (beta-lactamase superfamily II)